MSVPFPIGSLETTYQAFKHYYTSRNGSNKFESVYDTISNSSTVSGFFKETIQARMAPSGTDFVNLVLSMRYFIFAKTETRALGALIALKLWEEQVNSRYNLASESSVNYKVEAIFGKLNLLY